MIRFLKKVGFYKPTTIHTSYIICATPRSGSTLLCEALKNTSVAGRPNEYFDRQSQLDRSKLWRISSYTDYFEKVLEYGTTPNGVFGAKLMLDQFNYFISQVRQMPKYRALDASLERFQSFPPDEEILELQGLDTWMRALLFALFPNLHYVWITRLNKVRQAVSQSKAFQTRIFELKSDKPPKKQLTFSFEHINSFHRKTLIQEVLWQNYFDKCGIMPFKVVYEDFVDNYEETIKEILNYLKIPVPNDLGIDKRKLLKMSDALSEEWVKRYNEIKLRQTQERS
jgi:LPS sulfotransferase NodH